MAPFCTSQPASKAVKLWIELTSLRLVRWKDVSGLWAVWSFAISIGTVLPKTIVQRWLETPGCFLLNRIFDQFYDDQEKHTVDQVLQPNETILVRLISDGFYILEKTKNIITREITKQTFCLMEGTTALYGHLLRNIPKDDDCIVDMSPISMFEARKVMNSNKSGFLEIETTSTLEEIQQLLEGFDGTLCFTIYLEFGPKDEHATSLLYDSRAEGFILQDNESVVWIKTVKATTVGTRKEVPTFVCIKNISFNNRSPNVNPKTNEEKGQQKKKKTVTSGMDIQKMPTNEDDDWTIETVFTNAPPLNKSDRTVGIYNVLGVLLAKENRDTLRVEAEFEKKKKNKNNKKKKKKETVKVMKQWLGKRTDLGFKCSCATRKTNPTCSDKKLFVQLNYNEDEAALRKVLNQHSRCFAQV